MEVAEQHGAIYWDIITNAIPMIKRHLVVDLQCGLRSCLSGIELKNFTIILLDSTFILGLHCTINYYNKPKLGPTDVH